MVGVAAFQHEGSSSVVLIVILFVVDVFFGRALEVVAIRSQKRECWNIR